MLFRRRSRKDRIVAAAGRLVPSGRALAKAAGVVSAFAALTAASSSVSAVRRKQA
jgi:thymidine phosphorylase